MKNGFRVAAFAVALGGLLLGAAAPAQAKPGASTAPKLQMFNCVSDGALYGPCNTTQPGTIGWAKTAGPAGDLDGKSLAVTTATQFDGGYISYAGANAINTPIVGQTTAQVTALSFDTKGFRGGGAPRIGLSLSNGDQVFADPATCETLLGDGWYHADFRQLAHDASDTGPACTINTYFPGYTDSNGPNDFPTFSTGNGYTAWNWMNAASAGRGAPTITAAFLIQDWGPGTSYNDNLTFDNVVFSAPPSTR